MSALVKVHKRTLAIGSTLTPKRGKELDPVTVVELWRSDELARIKDAAVLAAERDWQERGIANRDGTRLVRFRELARDYWIESQAGERLPVLRDNRLTELLELAKLGAILPCRGKRPLTRYGVKEASSDPAQIERWHREYPAANFALATGRVTVLDIDGIEGAASLQRLERKIGKLPETLTVETGRGKHFYFASPKPLRCSVGKLGPGLDTRGAGGYVIAPPSVHPDTGEPYRYINPEARVAPLPPALFVLLEGRQRVPC